MCDFHFYFSELDEDEEMKVERCQAMSATEGSSEAISIVADISKAVWRIKWLDPLPLYS